MDLFDLAAKITLDSSGYERGLRDAESQTTGFGSKIGSAMKVAAGAITAATGAVLAFTRSSVKVGAEFDASMSQVAATMGYTVEELNTAGSEASQTFQTLRDFAQEMGSTTAFSATEASEALNYMALAGYDAETSMSMLPTVLNLAAAGSIGLAEASDMVTDAQSALGLTLEETVEMTDKMAVASSKSNTSVAQLGEAILTVGGTAKSLAGGTTELSAALGVLADNGIKGSEGGTALRNVILSLSAPTDQAAAKMKELGLEVYDAEGNMRPLNDIFLDLNGTLSTMTQGEQTEVLNTLFNKVDLKSANALLATSADRWDELSAAIDNADGAAQSMAEALRDNLQGDIKLFKSALEGAQIAISDGLTPALRKFVQFGSDGISKLTSAFKEGGLSGAMDAFGSILSDGLTMIINELPKFVDAGVQLIMSLAQGILQNLPTIVAAGLEIIAAVMSGVAEAIPQLLGMLPDLIGQVATTLIENLPLIIESGIQLIIAVIEGLSEAIPQLVSYVPQIVSTIVEVLINNVDMLVEAALQIIIALAEGLIKSLPKLLKKAPEIIASLVSAIIGAVGQLAQAAGSIISTLAQGIGARLSTIVTKGRELLVAFKNGVVSAVGSLASAGFSLVQGIWNGISNGLGWIKGKIQGWVGDVVSFTKKLFGIHSPSTVMRDQVGKFLALGIGEGFTREMVSVERMMQDAMPDLTGSVDVTGNYNGNGYGSGVFGGMAINGDVYISVDGTGKNAEEIGRELYQMLTRKVGAYAY